jgi:predicted AAA+ superfamily ATPase
LFPGRRGFGKDIVMMPLTFREFIKVFSPKVYEKIPKIGRVEKEEIFKKLVKHCHISIKYKSYSKST